MTLTGQVGGQPWSRKVPLSFGSNAEAASIPTLWARAAVESLQLDDFVTRGQGKPSQFETRISQLGLSYGIMTDYTSMVAVEQRIVNVGGKPRTVRVPVEEAQGVVVSRNNMAVPMIAGAAGATTRATGSTGATGGGGAGGAGGGQGGRGTLFAGNSPGTFARAGQPIYLAWDNGTAEKEEGAA